LIFRYTNKVSVEPRVYKNLKLFMENKDAEDELFDRLTVRNNIEEKIIYLFYLNRQLM
jgi:DNA topoisomerase-1